MLQRRARRRESKALLAALLSRGEPIRLEVGAGGRRGRNGWVTIDLAYGADIFWDLRRGLPFPAERVSAIYSSHFLEHLTYKEGQAFLDECLRVLTPGGTFSVAVPDARRYIGAYLDPQAPQIDQTLLWQPGVNHTTRIDLVNYMAYMDGHHKYMFDEENLVHILTAKGFRDVRLRGFDPALDESGRDFESIYAAARK